MNNSIENKICEWKVMANEVNPSDEKMIGLTKNDNFCYDCDGRDIECKYYTIWRWKK